MKVKAHRGEMIYAPGTAHDETLVRYIVESILELRGGGVFNMWTRKAKEYGPWYQASVCIPSGERHGLPPESGNVITLDVALTTTSVIDGSLISRLSEKMDSVTAKRRCKSVRRPRDTRGCDYHPRR